MAIIIGDIHGDIAMAHAFLNFKPEVEHVALGDLVDSRTQGTIFEDELSCLNLLLRSNSVLLWGNHDLAYLPRCRWQNFSNYPDRAETFEYIYRGERGRFKAAHSVDGWLCTHAGVSTTLSATLSKGLWDYQDSGAIAEWLNGEFECSGMSGPLFARDWTRGGDDKYGGIFWYDPNKESARPDSRVKQLFGHTQEPGPMKKPTWVNIHIESGLGHWVYDTEVDDFVCLRS